MNTPVTSAIIFNEETDREDWLERCLESMKGADTTVQVYRFKISEPLRPRQYRIARDHKNGWLLFVDPDDYVTGEFPTLVDYLRDCEHDAVWTPENWLNADGSFWKLYDQPHHIIALRDDALSRWLKLSEQKEYTQKWALPDGYGFKYFEPVYNWFPKHGGNTYGLPPGIGS